MPNELATLVDYERESSPNGSTPASQRSRPMGPGSGRPLVDPAVIVGKLAFLIHGMRIRRLSPKESGPDDRSPNRPGRIVTSRTAGVPCPGCPGSKEQEQCSKVSGPPRTSRACYPGS